MKTIKGVLLDLDNTLYDYSRPHSLAIKKVGNFFTSKFGYSEKDFQTLYYKGRKKVQFELNEYAASHNRLLYFQKLLELIGVPPFKEAILMYNIYWDTFLDEMRLFDGVLEFFQNYQGKICIVSDLTAEIQYRKIENLGIGQYLDAIVTSEESGREKPHPFPFLMALDKLKIQKNYTVMIGDNFKKDILGASNIEMKSIWLNSEGLEENYDANLVFPVKSFNQIIEKL